MKRFVKPTLIALLFMAFFFLLGFLNRYYAPKIKQWLIVEVEKQSRRHSPLRIWPTHVDLHLLPLGATFHEVRVLPQRGLESFMAPTTLKSLKVSISTWSLLKGQIRIGEVVLDGADLHVILRENLKATAGKTPFSLDLLNQIPIDEVHIQNIHLTSKIEKQNLLSQTKNLNVVLENRYRTLKVDLQASEFKLKKTGLPSLFESDVELRLLLDDEGLYFSNAKIQKENSFLMGSGSITGRVLDGQFKDLRTKVRGDLQLNEVRRVAVEFIPPEKIPEFNGHVNFESDISYTPLQDVRSHFLLNAQDLTIDKYNVGEVLITGKTASHQMILSKMSIKNIFGHAGVENFQMNLKDKFDFKGQLLVDNLELSTLLGALGLKGVPVYTHLDSRIPCSGQIQKPFSVTCTGQIHGRDFFVTSGPKIAPPIVSFKKFMADGSVTVGPSSVEYKADLKIGESKGQSQGIISYKDGFKINYSTPRLLFSDLIELARLKPEGAVAIQGETTGNSKTATIDLKATGEDLWLHDFALGKAQFHMRYKKGTLFFDKIDGQLGSSRYKADLSVNLKTDRLHIEGHSPFVDAEDILQAFSRKVQLPIPISGTGSSKFKIHGPFDFSRLSYDFESSLYRGAIANESFDQVQFNVISQDGFVEAKRIVLTKGRSQARVQGHVKPSGMMDVTLRGQNFQIEQSENLAQLKLNLSGNMDVDMRLTDHILSPSIELSGRLTQVMTGDTSAQDSQFQISMNKKELSGKGSLLGTNIEAQFQHFFGERGSTRVHFKSNNWNFAPVFSIFSDSLRGGHYQTQFTGLLDLEIPNKAPQSFSGELKIQDLLLRSGKTEMKIPHPVSLTAQNGLITAQNFEILGDNTYVRLQSKSATTKSLGLHLDGRVDLTLASLITPFLDDIRGLLSFSISLSGPFERPVLAGSSYIENGVFRLKNFPHPLEQVSGDAIFSHDKIIINSVKGRIGGGAFSANGQIQVAGLSRIPVDLRGQFNDSRFNVPEGFSTRGSGNFFVKGSWFPYTVGVNYDIDSGIIERKGGAATRSTPEIKPSAYLPKFLSVKRFSPITLELDINMRRLIPVKMMISRIDIRSEVGGQLKINGPPEAPLLTGKVNIARGGKVTFRNNTFEIESGYVEYRNSPPENPILNVQAEAKVTAQIGSNETRDYDVDLKVQGTAADPRVIVSSEPVLAETELISLLTLGFISPTAAGGAEGTEPTTQEELTNTSYQLGSAFLSEQLGLSRVLESQLGVRFDISSSYDTSDKAEKHKFTLRKQWTPKFGTSASREIGKTNTNNFKAEYKLNKNLSVIGEWEGTESTGAEQTETSEKNQNIFGLDIEYKVEFK